MGIFDFLFGKKKIGLDPNNKDKYIYYHNSGTTEDVRDVDIWNSHKKTHEKERGDIYSEEHHPNGKLKKITIRKTIKRRGEEKIQIIRTFYENGNSKTKDTYKFYDRSSTYKKNGLSFEYYEPDNGSDQWVIDRNVHKKITEWKNGRKTSESVTKNGKAIKGYWADKSKEIDKKKEITRAVEKILLNESLSDTKKINQEKASKVPDGNHKQYYENRDIQLDFNYKDGVQHGVQKEFYKGGQISLIANYKNGKPHGLREQYYPSGNLETRAKYVTGLIEGVYIYLKDNGDVIEEKIMSKGIDITLQLMTLMMEGDRMIKSGVIKDGAQNPKPGETSQKMYEYYLANKKDMKI